MRSPKTIHCGKCVRLQLSPEKYKAAPGDCEPCCSHCRTPSNDAPARSALPRANAGAWSRLRNRCQSVGRPTGQTTSCPGATPGTACGRTYVQARHRFTGMGAPGLPGPDDCQAVATPCRPASAPERNNESAASRDHDVVVQGYVLPQDQGARGKEQETHSQIEQSLREHRYRHPPEVPHHDAASVPSRVEQP